MDLDVDGSLNYEIAKTALLEVEHKIYWTDDPNSPSYEPSLKDKIKADLVIVGGGFTGLWAALQAAEENPGRSIVVLEAEEVGHGGSSRNGGFCDVSLSHGIVNGLSHWNTDFPRLWEMGIENMKGILDTIKKYHIDASVEQPGYLFFALDDWQMPEIIEEYELYQEYGIPAALFNKEEVSNHLKSSAFVGGMQVQDGSIMINPAQLVWGLKKACLSNGVKIFEKTKVTGLNPSKSSIEILTTAGKVKASKVILATNAWAAPLSSQKKYILPIYDHVLMTEPLTNSQMDSIGWKGREGCLDMSNQFQYFRLSKDNRILWGGHDAKYYKNNGIGRKYENAPASYLTLAGTFLKTFPQLEGIKFTHKWAGPIGSTTKFAAAFGTRYKGKLAWVGGYTGLGVGASRFGARVALDLIEGKETERTQLQMVRKKPFPFPPEPFRNQIVQYTIKQLAKSDNNAGKRSLWLKILDTLGLGLES